jgi:hypothetical protein
MKKYKYKISKGAINYFLFQVVVIFIFYDGIRHYLLYNEYISQLKELLVLILFFLSILKKSINKSFKIFNFGLLLFFLYHSLVGVCSFPFFSSFSSFTVFYKTYQLLMLIYAFYSFKELTHTSTIRFLTFITKVGVSFVIINTTLYFVELPIWEEYQPWWGRISCGYPTMDTISLSYVLVILLYFENIIIKPLKRWIYVCIILFGIFVQATGTGIVIIGGVTTVSLFYFLFFNSSKLLRKNVLAIVTTIIVVLALFPIIINKFQPEQYNQISFLIDNKISNLLGEDVDLNTMEMRENQYKKALMRQDTDLKKIFGIGLGDVTFNMEVKENNPNSIYIEDQYSLNKISYGYIGFVFFILFIMITIGEIISMKQVVWQTKILFCLSIMIFAANSKTLISLVLFSNTAFFAFFYATLKRVKNDRLFYLENFYPKHKIGLWK